MNVQCDVCEKAAATLLCCADEAALCGECDTQVHAANKVAGQHERVALIAQNSSSTSCDICQEKSGHFFCVEDRALLCRECDVSIHTATKLASKHKRFLVSGVQVGLDAMAPLPFPSPASPPPHICNSEANSIVGLGAMMPACLPPPPTPPLVSNFKADSIVNIAIMETIQHTVPHSPISQTWPSPLVPSITLSPAHDLQQALAPSMYLSNCLSHLDEFLNLSSSTTTLMETPSRMSIPNLEWDMPNSTLALDVLSASTYLFEDSIAEVPSTPIASPSPLFQDPSSTKRKRYMDEPIHSTFDHTFLVQNTIFPPFKQSRNSFYGGYWG